MERKESSKEGRRQTGTIIINRGQSIERVVSRSSLCPRITVLYSLHISHASNGRYSGPWSLNQSSRGKRTSTTARWLNRKNQSWPSQYKTSKERLEWGLPMPYDSSYQGKHPNGRYSIFLWHGKCIYLHTTIRYAKIGSLEKIIRHTLDKENQR